MQIVKKIIRPDFLQINKIDFNALTPEAFRQKRIFLDILEIFSLKMGRISSHLLKKEFATWQHAYLSISITQQVD